MNLRLLLWAGLCLLASALCAQTPVERHGKLRVDGTLIKDECGRAVQLKGVSFPAHHWGYDRVWTSGTVKWLRDDWKAEIIRAPLGVRYAGFNDTEGDYIDDPVGSVKKIRKLVDAAIEHNVYVLIDFHAHENYLAKAKTFFDEVAELYGDSPNVIYEIWNEPIAKEGGDESDSDLKESWWEIRPYAREVIAKIRKHDADNLIVVGTPQYDLYPEYAAANPLKTDINGKAVSNIAYTIHFYAGGGEDWDDGGGSFHEWTRGRFEKALDKGLALFATECGRVGWDYGPNNSLDAAEWNRWEDWMDEHAISYCKWAVTDKNERTSMLKPSASNTGNWSSDDLTAEGKWTRNRLRNVNTPAPSRCGATSSNDSGSKKYRGVYAEGFM